MEAKPRDVDELARLGLTTYEARAYLALLGRGSLSAAEVARQGGLPRQRIYDVLRSLVEKGMASERPADVTKYSAVPPDHALGRLVETQRQILANAERSAKEMAERLRPAYESGRQYTNPLEYIQVLRGGAAVSGWIAELPDTVQNELLVLTKPPLRRPDPDTEAALAVVKKVPTRSIYESSLLDDPESLEWIQGFVREGEEARFLDELPLKLVIVDEATVLFGLPDREGVSSDLTTMVVEHPALARILKEGFDSLWARSLTLEEALASRSTTSR